MAKSGVVKYTNLTTALEKVIAAHAAIGEGIAGHASVAHAALQAKREKARVDNALKSGSEQHRAAI